MKTFRGSASLASPAHIRNNQQIRHLTFRPFFNHLMMAVPPRSLFYARHRDPFFARVPSLSSSAFHGVPRLGHFLTSPPSPPLTHHLHHHHRPSPSRTTILRFLRRPHPPCFAAASSLHRCEVALSHVRAPSGVRAPLHDADPYPIARRCGS